MICAFPAIVALSAACGSVIVWLVRFTNAVGDALLMRTFPRLIGALFTTGLAVLMTLATVLIVPLTPNAALPTASEPSPLLTLFTAPALVKFTPIVPLIVPAVLVFTVTSMPLEFEAPATRPLIAIQSVVTIKFLTAQSLCAKMMWRDERFARSWRCSRRSARIDFEVSGVITQRLVCSRHPTCRSCCSPICQVLTTGAEVAGYPGWQPFCTYLLPRKLFPVRSSEK